LNAERSARENLAERVVSHEYDIQRCFAALGNLRTMVELRLGSLEDEAQRCLTTLGGFRRSVKDNKEVKPEPNPFKYPQKVMNFITLKNHLHTLRENAFAQKLPNWFTDSVKQLINMVDAMKKKPK
jgi:hypothetical protein